MKHILLIILSIIMLVCTTAPANAGFTIKKSAALQTGTAHSSIAAEQLSPAMAESQKAGAVNEVSQLLHAPLQNWAARGWVGTLALICGALGFIMPFFGFAAVLLGFIGMGRRRNRHTGVAIAGFVLGMIVVLAVIFGGFTGWGIS